MEIELLEIKDFLASYHPFNQLPDSVLKLLPEKLEVRYFRHDTEILSPGMVNRFLFVIRTGAVEVQTEKGELLARLGEGDTFGFRALLRDGVVIHRVVTLEDSLLYQLSVKDINQLCQDHVQFTYFFGPTGADRLRNAIDHFEDERGIQLDLMTTSIRNFITRTPVSMPPTATIRETASLMRKEQVSSMLIIEEGKLIGIITDRDLRNRVVAKVYDIHQPVSTIMTPKPYSVTTSTLGFEAQLLMAKHNIHHMPVEEKGEVIGIISATTLTRHQTTSAVYVVSDIYKHKTVDKLRESSVQVPNLLLNLVAANAKTNRITGIITTVSDAITTRLIQLAEKELGLPPVPYAWLAAGSQGRNEQTVQSDQDNCLLLGDEYDEKRDGWYFKTFAKIVNDGLNQCGYIYCPGNMMAGNDKWRQSLSTWKTYFDRWIYEPDPKALLLSCIFFDLRFVYGTEDLFTKLNGHVLSLTKKNGIFLAYMANNALLNPAPLGFFRNFVLIKGGEHNRMFDLKHKGVVPIVDLARVYALAAGISEVNTKERLSCSVLSGEISQEGARDLNDAFDFISSIRLKHQAMQIKKGQKADNFMSSRDLSNFERNHLKDAFVVVRTMQNSLAQRFQMRR